MSNNNSELQNSNTLYCELTNNSYDDDKDDEIIDLINDVKLRSKFKAQLINILYYLQKFPFLLIIIEYLIGFLFIGIPFLLVYIKGNKNKIVTYYLICIIILLILTILFLIIRINIDINNNFFIFATWERNNILSFIGLIITLFIILFIFLNFDSFEKQIKQDKITFNSKNGTSCKDEDIIFKYFLLNYLYNSNSNITSFSIDFNRYNKDIIFTNIKKAFYKFLIPFFIFIIIKTIKTCLLRKKNSKEKIVIGFCSIIEIIIIYLNCENKLKKKKEIFTYIEIILNFIILIFFLLWTTKEIFKKIIKRNEKNLGIFKLSCYYIFLSLISDIIFIFGIFYCLLSFIVFFYSLINSNNENFEDLLISFKKIKYSIPFIFLGNIFYFGNTFLILIFQPIVIEYFPGRLKNKNYIKLKKNLSNNYLIKQVSIFNLNYESETES